MITTCYLCSMAEDLATAAIMGKSAGHDPITGKLSGRLWGAAAGSAGEPHHIQVGARDVTRVRARARVTYITELVAMR
jgi:hypothetical protein